MPRNGSGSYTLVNNSWNPAVNGVNATAADWQTLINDVAAAITASLSKDGQTTMTGNLQMGGNVLSGLGAPTGAGQSLRWEQLTKGADITSAGTITIPTEGSFFSVTGTATITTIPDTYPGRIVYLSFAAGITLTNSASLVLPGGINVKTQANDVGLFINTAPGIWQLVQLESANTNLTGWRFTLLSGSGNYTVPDGVYNLEAEIDGAGGGGGGVGSPGNLGGGGGGGGGKARKMIPVTPGQSIAYVCGAAGAAGAAGGGGGTGGTSSFGAVSATGGSGGASNGTGVGGAPGVGIGGDISMAGSYGQQATTANGGGGGSSASGGGGGGAGGGSAVGGFFPGGGGGGRGPTSAGVGTAGAAGCILIRT